MWSTLSTLFISAEEREKKERAEQKQKEESKQEKARLCALFLVKAEAALVLFIEECVISDRTGYTNRIVLDAALRGFTDYRKDFLFSDFDAHEGLRMMRVKLYNMLEEKYQVKMYSNAGVPYQWNYLSMIPEICAGIRVQFPQDKNGAFVGGLNSVACLNVDDLNYT